MGAKYHFSYDTTSNWDNLNAQFLSRYQVVLFLDTRPEVAEQREAFRKYMEDGGAWMGFHFAAFALFSFQKLTKLSPRHIQKFLKANQWLEAMKNDL